MASRARRATVRSSAVADAGMREFWDARAEENAYYFIDNRLDYRDPDWDAFWTGGREALDKVIELLGVEIAPTDSIVEIGCGLGRITRGLAERGAEVRALDVSERMLDRARTLNADLGNVEWVLGDGRTLAPIETGSADVCHSFVVFQHLPDPAMTLAYVREMGRVLRPDGIAFFQVSNAPAVHRKPGRIRRALRAAGSWLGSGPGGQSHPAWLGSPTDLGDLEPAAAQSGMRVERLVGAGTPFCFVLLRKTAADGRPGG